jgi:NAD(P)-dependent dehydrogenase (short-subunit alcohol dehydrogenase family)
VSDYRFDGRVAIVTGAGRGIGRGYARLLAARGARVVVNDLGASVQGEGADVGPANAVVAEILEAGGAAVADGHDVSSETGARALVDQAVERYGRLDIVVNNAGIIRWAGFPEVDEENLAAHHAVHVLGTFNICRAAWPHMVSQGYGRIVNTTSAGIFGLPANLSYATAKGAVIGLSRSLATSARKHGILVNLIAPAARTRMAGPASEEGQGSDADDMAADLVAPLVAYLCHEECPVNGEIYAAGAGRFQRLFIAATEGYVAERPSIEDVVAHWATINDEAGSSIPGDLMSWSATFLAHLDPER